MASSLRQSRKAGLGESDEDSREVKKVSDAEISLSWPMLRVLP